MVEILSFWYNIGKTIIFVNSYTICDWLNKNLLRNGYECVKIHSKLLQIDRLISLYVFRKSKFKILLATSIVSRGLDFKNLNLIINYQVPKTYQDYVHKIGRTGRVGLKGTSITLINEEDIRHSYEILRYLNKDNINFINIKISKSFDFSLSDIN